MIPWYVAIIALFAGVIFGIVIVAVLSANGDEDE